MKAYLETILDIISLTARFDNKETTLLLYLHVKKNCRHFSVPSILYLSNWDHTCKARTAGPRRPEPFSQKQNTSSRQTSLTQNFYDSRAKDMAGESRRDELINITVPNECFHFFQ